ncbi:MAG TPA: hypothetical protein G4O18_02325 [Dehalococcoidia bacterium]|nr:hypothetical protein [Dehalococcoidia bacterium]
MTKYEQAKYRVRTKARIEHTCFVCGQMIVAGDYYYRERLDMQKPPSLILKEFCEKCGIEQPSDSGGT